MQTGITVHRTINQIISLAQSGRHSEALPLAKKLSRKHPDDAQVWLVLAGLHAASGNMDSVIDCCERSIKLNPRHAGAHYNLATALHHAGRHNEALAAYRKCLELDTNSTAAMTGIGKVCQSLGRFAAAQDSFIAAHRREPGNPGHLINIGMACSAGGKQQEACDYYRRAMQLDPGSAEAWYLTGIALQSDQDFTGAINAYRNAIKRKPGHLEALNNLGHLLSESGKLQEAARVFRELTSAHPGNAQAWSNLGVVCDSMGLVEEAETAYRKAITIDPCRTDTLCHLGYMLGSEGRTREAIDCFDRSISLAPGLDTAIAGKASVLEKSGDLKTAAHIIQPLIDSGTDSTDAVLAYSRIAMRLEEPEPAIRLATGMLEHEGLPEKAVSDLHRTLGELFEHRKDFDTAFRHFELANRHAPCTYKESAQTAFIDRVIKHTGADILGGLPRARQNFRKIAFIIGMPRSGTSLVEQIISSHPDVFGGGELRYMGDIACASQLLSGSQGEFPEAIPNIDQAAIDTLAQTYIDAVKKIAPANAFITDKMPHNFRFLGLIALMFPGARIIHVRRNPLDNCLSLYFQSFNPLHSYATDLRLLGGYYRQYERLMQHWHNVLDIPIHDIGYEDIVGDLQTATARLLDICGLPWSDSCLEFHKSGRFVKTPSYDQVRRPIYTNSVDRWRNYSNHLDPLRDALGLKP